MELMFTIALMTILIAILDYSLDAVKAKVRYTQIKSDMDAIAQAAYNDYTTNGVWAALTFGAMPPSWASHNELKTWPIPPCPGWYYSWEDWSLFGMPATQVTLRRTNNTLLWSYCLDTSQGGSCATDPLFGGSTRELSTIESEHIYCNE